MKKKTIVGYPYSLGDQKVINNKKVFTIGHSNRNMNEFIEILLKYKVKTLIDVRRFPKSTRYPHFNKEILEQVLQRKGIKYTWIGESLGGYRDGGYEEYMKTKKYLEGINKLIEIICNSPGSIAIMCSERLWFKCHRKFIADTLVERGYEVIHIIDKDKIQIHKPKKDSNLLKRL